MYSYEQCYHDSAKQNIDYLKIQLSIQLSRLFESVLNYFDITSRSVYDSVTEMKEMRGDEIDSVTTIFSKL